MSDAFYRCGNWGQEKLNNLFKLTQFLGGWPRILHFFSLDHSANLSQILQYRHSSSNPPNLFHAMAHIGSSALAWHREANKWGCLLRWALGTLATPHRAQQWGREDQEPVLCDPFPGPLVGKSALNYQFISSSWIWPVTRIIWGVLKNACA